jgi:hypothetical protein
MNILVENLQSDIFALERVSEACAPSSAVVQR